MTYTSLLVHVQPIPDQNEHLRCAAALADEFQALTIGLGAEAIPPLEISAGGAYAAVDGQWVSILQEQIAADLDKSRQIFEAALAPRPNEWRTCWFEPTDAMAQIARAADLIIVRNTFAFGQDPYRRVDPGRLLLQAGRPVLLCPPGQDALVPGPALVAWKDTREARRVLIDALPLLRRATSILVVEVCDAVESDAANRRVVDVVATLARHGVIARCEVLPRARSTTDAVIDRASQLGANLIVAGGYGHSRLGEWVFGGMTRQLLNKQQRFLLLSH